MTHRARKRFGQHFLVDEAVIEAIVGAVDPRPGEAIVEIGPGLGAITRPLLERCAAVTAIEIDRDLAERLRRLAGLELIEADVLRVDFAALAAAQGKKLRVVGNLPYNISTPILFHLLDAIDSVADQHVMLQTEVAERIAAAPGGKAYGRLSVMLQWRYATEVVLDIAPEAFDPPPKVRSTVLRMLPKASWIAVRPSLLGELVTTAFSQRRKLLRHTLGRWLGERGLEPGFDLQRRAEEVPVDEYARLAASVQAQLSGSQVPQT